MQVLQIKNRATLQNNYTLPNSSYLSQFHSLPYVVTNFPYLCHIVLQVAQIVILRNIERSKFISSQNLCIR